MATKVMKSICLAVLALLASVRRYVKPLGHTIMLPLCDMVPVVTVPYAMAVSVFPDTVKLHSGPWGVGILEAVELCRAVPAHIPFWVMVVVETSRLLTDHT